MLTHTQVFSKLTCLRDVIALTYGKPHTFHVAAIQVLRVYACVVLYVTVLRSCVIIACA